MCNEKKKESLQLAYLVERFIVNEKISKIASKFCEEPES